MRLERVKRWQWIGVAVLVGSALAWARRIDDDLPSRLGEGVADQRWFEREVRRRVPLADGSTVPAFGRLTVYPLSVPERGGRRPVHVVAGMYLAEVNDTGAANTGAVGKLRPYFFIAPVPYPSTADVIPGKPNPAAATVRDYLDGLRDDGIHYTYAWWADARYATAAWVGGSVLVIGLLWPTLLNLLVYGRLFAPAQEKATSLWNVKPAGGKPLPPRNDSFVPVSTPGLDLPVIDAVSHSAQVAVVGPPAAVPMPLVLSAVPNDDTPVTAEDRHKEFGAKRDDFYPTELKVSARNPV